MYRSKITALLIIFFCCVYTNDGFAQSRYGNRSVEKKNNLKYLVGVQYGPEVLMSIPKVSLQYFEDLSKRKQSAFYVGGELSLWLHQSFWVSGGVNGGLKYGVFSIESSLSALFWPKSKFQDTVEEEKYFHLALTPKAGIYLFDLIWFKVGPTIFLYQNYSGDLNQTVEPDGKKRLNFEIMFNTAIRKKKK